MLRRVVSPKRPSWSAGVIVEDCWQDLWSCAAGAVQRVSIATLRRRRDAARKSEDGVYGRFIRMLGDGGWHEFLYDCPVAARLAAQAVVFWVDAVQELSQRLARDRSRLQMTFGNGVPLGPVVHLETGLSDFHHGHRSVCRVRFASGVEVFYKPKPLDVDAAFANLVAWCNRNGCFLG